MSNKELTPIQLAIAERVEMIIILQNKWLENANTDKEEAYLMLIEIVQSGIDNLKLLLPTERTFAEKLFDAGIKLEYKQEKYRKGIDTDLSGYRFDDIYKKYEDE